MDVRVSEYTQTLQVTEKILGDLEKSLTLQTRDAHISELIHKNKENQKMIQNAKKFETGLFKDLPEMVSAPTGMDTKIHWQYFSVL